MSWPHGHDTRPLAQLSFWAWMHGGPLIQLSTECSLDFQATWVIDVLGIFIDMPSMGVRKSRHSQTSGRLVQGLNVCTLRWSICL